MKRLILSIFVLLSMLGSAVAQISNSTVTGVVYDASGDPLANKTITFRVLQQIISGNVVAQSIKTATTDASGNISTVLPQRAAVQVTVDSGMTIMGLVPASSSSTLAEVAGKIQTVTPPVVAGDGGTGIDTSASTGTARVDSGTWSVTHVLRSTAVGLTASTTQTQGQGALTASINQVTTVTNPNDVRTLPTALTGRKVVVINDGANDLQVFPDVSDDLGNGLNISTVIRPGLEMSFVALDATNWQTRLIAGLPRYTTAALPASCNEGDQAQVTDGDVAESVVQCDDSDVWRCLRYYELGEIHLSCPPYNATTAAVDNSTAILAAYADMKDNRGSYVTGRGVYDTTVALTYADDDAESGFNMKGPGNYAFQIYCKLAIAGICLNISSSITANNILFQDVGFRGTSASTILINIDATFAQLQTDRLWLSNVEEFGVRLNSTSNFSLVNGHCGFDSIPVAGGACIQLNAVANGVISGWNVEHAGSTEEGCFIQWGSATVSQNVTITNNVGVVNAPCFMDDGAFSAALKRITVAFNNFEAMRKGIILDGAGLKQELTFVHNNFQFESSDVAVSGETCLHLRLIEGDGGGSLVAGNTCDGFFYSILSNRNTGTTFADNTFKNTVDACVADLFGDDDNVWKGNKVIGGCGTVLVDTSLTGASGGNNIFKDTIFVGATSKAGGLVVDATNLALTDRFLLADGDQTLVIADDTVGAQVATGAVQPYYFGVVVDCNDPDGCDTTLSTAAGSIRDGMRISVRLAASPGTTNQIISGSTDTITINDVFDYVVQNGGWRKI